jgi:hypothetical protein
MSAIPLKADSLGVTGAVAANRYYFGVPAGVDFPTKEIS